MTHEVSEMTTTPRRLLAKHEVYIASDRLDLPWGQRGEATTEGTIVIDGVTRNWCLGEFVEYTGPTTADLIKELVVQRPDDMKLFMDGRYRNTKGPGLGYSGVEMFIDGSNEWRKRADAIRIYHAIVAALQERHHPDHCSCCH